MALRLLCVCGRPDTGVRDCPLLKTFTLSIGSDLDSVTNPLRFDPRFAAVRIGRWTTVRIGDHDAARAIAHYLEVDHPVLGLFDADLFMESLGSGSQDFCSAFLVNTVLLWSCVSVFGPTLSHTLIF